MFRIQRREVFLLLGMRGRLVDVSHARLAILCTVQRRSLDVSRSQWGRQGASQSLMYQEMRCFKECRQLGSKAWAVICSAAMVVGRAVIWAIVDVGRAWASLFFCLKFRRCNLYNVDLSLPR